MTRLPITRMPAEGRAIAVVGDVYRFLATGEETGGRYAVWEALVHALQVPEYLVPAPSRILLTLAVDAPMLFDALGTTVAIRPGRKGSGQLIVRYGSLEHLDTLLAKLRD